MPEFCAIYRLISAPTVDSSIYHIPENPKPADRLVTMYHDLVAIKDYYQFNTKQSVTSDP